MPVIIVDLKKCNGCPNYDEARCAQACPGDLMAVNPESKKAYIREQSDCWDCLCCVKACPRSALRTKLPFALAGYGASLVPKVSEEQIKWISTDAQGNREEFVVKRREV